jgi:hypothetical protein
MASSIQALLMAMIEERKNSNLDEGNQCSWQTSDIHTARETKSDSIVSIDLDDKFIVVRKIDSQWPKLFDIYFLSAATRLAPTSTSITSDDDLIFYVTRNLDNDLQRVCVDNPESFVLFNRSFTCIIISFLQHLVEVFRHHDTKRRPKLVKHEKFIDKLANDMAQNSSRQHLNTIGKRRLISILFFISLNIQ